MIDSLFTFIKQISLDIWNVDPSFYTKVMTLVIIVVFLGTFLSNHYFRWRCFYWNTKLEDAAIEVEDTIFGLKIKPVPLKDQAQQLNDKAQQKEGGGG